MHRWTAVFGAASLLLIAGVGTAQSAPAESHGNGSDTPATEEVKVAGPIAAQRRQLELEARNNPYAITPHRANFMLPISYSHRPSGIGPSSAEQERWEVKFQLSLKAAVWADIFDWPLDLYFAYTGLSFWQAYNSDFSAPFRDTNHEPEIFLQSHANWNLGPIDLINLRFGFNHQSNGQSVPLSRSWNRLYLGVNGRWDRFFADLEFWYRIPEEAKDDPLQAEGDDNPNIERFVGQGQFSLAWQIDQKSVHVKWRNNFRADNRGSLTAAFTFPINRKLKGYLEVFTGYGESLLDYQRSNERLSLGVALSDWF